MHKGYPLSLFLGLALALGACQKNETTPKPAEAPASGSPGAAPATPPAAAVPAAAGATSGALTRTKAPDGAKVSFTGIKDGDTVSSPVKFGFAVEGLKIAPAGTSEPGTAHHHLIIDSELPPQDAPLPANDHVQHFGKGQTETEVTLPPGPHTLQLEAADYQHLPFDPPVVSDRISITVK
jgi:hypothetical protein